MFSHIRGPHNLTSLLKEKLNFFWLGVLTRNNIINCDFVSAKSKFSLELMALKDKEMIVSVNGSTKN